MSVCLSVSIFNEVRRDEVKRCEEKWGEWQASRSWREWSDRAVTAVSRWEDASPFLSNYRTRGYRNRFDNQWKNRRKRKRERGQSELFKGKKKRSVKSMNDDGVRSFRGHAFAIRWAMIWNTVFSISCWLTCVTKQKIIFTIGSFLFPAKWCAHFHARSFGTKHIYGYYNWVLNSSDADR